MFVCSNFLHIHIVPAAFVVFLVQLQKLINIPESEDLDTEIQQGSVETSLRLTEGPTV